LAPTALPALIELISFEILSSHDQHSFLFFNPLPFFYLPFPSDLYRGERSHSTSVDAVLQLLCFRLFISRSHDVFACFFARLFFSGIGAEFPRGFSICFFRPFYVVPTKTHSFFNFFLARLVLFAHIPPLQFFPIFFSEISLRCDYRWYIIFAVL